MIADFWEKPLVTRVVWASVVIFFVFVFFPADKVLLVFPDGNYYMGLASNIISGRGYVGLDHVAMTREPGFPYLLSLIIALTSSSTLGVYIFVRFFFLINLILVYILMREVSQPAAAVVVLILLIFTPALNYWQSYIHIDHVILSFLFLTLWLFIRALKTGLSSRFIVAGASLGFAYLVKTPNTLAILPILLLLGLIKEFRDKRNLQGWGLAIASALLLVSPWLIYSSQLEGEIYVRGTADVVNALPTSNDQQAWQTILTLFPTYYFQYLQKNFALAPLLVVAFIYAVAKPFMTKKQPDKIVAAVLIGLIPLAFFLIADMQRARQSQLIFTSLYMALAILLIDCAQGLNHLLKPNRTVKLLIQASIPLLIIGLQFLIPPSNILNAPNNYGMRDYLRDFNVYLLWQNFDDQSWHNSEYVRFNSLPTAEWMIENIPPNATIGFNNESQLRSFYLPTTGRYRFHRLAVYGYPRVKRLRFEGDQVVSIDVADLTNDFGSRIVWRSQLATINGIERFQTDYIVETDPVMSLYYLEHPSFLLIHDFEDGHIFKVIAPAEPILFPTYLSMRLQEQLTEDTEIEELATAFFDQVLQSPIEKASLMPPSPYLLYPNDVISIFVEQRKQLGAEAVEQELDNLANSLEQSLWSIVTQARLYHLLADFKGDIQYAQSAAQAYDHVLQEAPNVPEPALTMLESHLKQYILLANIDGRLVNASLLERLAQSSDSAERWFIVGEAYRLLQQNEAATEAYLNAINLQPNKIYLVRLGNVYLTNGTFAQAIDVFNRGKELYADDPRFYIGLGQAYARSQQFDLAINAYRQAVEIDTTSAFALLGLADALRLNGDYTEAADVYQRGIVQFPTINGFYAGLADVYALNGEFQTAVTIYEQVIALDQTFGRAYIQLGRLYENANLLEEAIEVYERGLANITNIQQQNTLRARLNQIR